mgnify:CR=1 FL=1
MDDIIDRIKGYVLIVDSTLVDNDLLDFMVSGVIDRVLAYTNRQQLVVGYKDFLSGDYYNSNYYLDRDGVEQPILPIPTELERAIASAIVGAYRTQVNSNTETTGNVTQMSDNGQSISYGDGLATYFTSKSDAEIFSGIKSILDNFRIPTIVETT